MRWQNVIGMILALWLVVGCSPHPKRTVVEEAIRWQVQHPVGIRQELVGSHELGSRIQVVGVKVKRDQRWRGEVLTQAQPRIATGRVLSGSYTVKIGREKRTLPFSLVLVPEPPDWFLGIRDGSHRKLQAFTDSVATTPEATKEFN